MFSTIFLPAWDTLQSSILISVLSIYSWATAFFEAIPNYFVMDAILAIWSIWHLFVAFSFLAVGDAFYKSTLINVHHAIVKKLDKIPLFFVTAVAALTIQTACLGYMAFQQQHLETTAEANDSAISLRALVSAYTLVCALILKKFSNAILKVGPKGMMDYEQTMQQHDIAHWKTPPKWTSIISAPTDLILRPCVEGLENISTEQPALYVSNHSLHGVEMPSFVSLVYRLKGVFLRGLGDSFHFGNAHGEFLRYFGTVVGTRENVDTLMETKQNVLVYPGGGHEIFKPSTVPKYELMWKDRLGFARMAIKHGYPVVPCCGVGTEDMLDIVYDIPVGFIRKGLTVPVLGPILPHRLQREYFWFGEPIPTAQYNGDWKNDEFAREVRDKVKAAVEAGIREMQQKQAKDPNRFLLTHMANVAKSSLQSAIEFCKDPFAVVSSKDEEEEDAISIVPLKNKKED